VVRCLNCGLMQTDPRPTSATIGLYYPQDYGPYLSTKVLNSKTRTSQNRHFIGLRKGLLKPLYRKIIDLKTACLPSSLQPGKMIELGCASGSYMQQMATRGWQVQGIESSSKAAEEARQLGFDVYTGTLESAPDPEYPMDLIVGWMVLEHLHDPVLCLKKLRRWAHPGTWLVLSIPNAGSLEFSLFGNRWYALQLPTHLYHFTPETLEKLLNTAGWNITKIHHQRILSNLIASLGYYLSDKGYKKAGQALIKFPEKAGRKSHLALYPLAWLLSKFGQTGRMTVWAKIKP